MKLLTDTEIVALLSAPTPSVVGVKPPTNGDWFTDPSPVEPASLDLTIGEIYVPGEQSWSEELKSTDYMSLEPGGTAVILVEQTLALPGTIAGLALPKSRVAFRGILITNPGHVDPGYRGPLRFTVINMGRENYSLRKGEPIAKLLLFHLEKKPTKDWFERANKKAAEKPTKEDLHRLTRDFLNVESRASAEANSQIAKMGFPVVFITTVWVVLLGFALNYVSTRHDAEVDARLSKLEEATLTAPDLSYETSQFQDRLTKAESQNSNTQVQLDALKKDLNAKKNGTSQ